MAGLSIFDPIYARDSALGSGLSYRERPLINYASMYAALAATSAIAGSSFRKAVLSPSAISPAIDSGEGNGKRRRYCAVIQRYSLAIRGE